MIPAHRQEPPHVRPWRPRARECAVFGEELSRLAVGQDPRFGYQGTAWMRLAAGVGRILNLSPTRIYLPGVGRFGDVDPLTAIVMRAGPTAYALLPFGHGDYWYVLNRPTSLVDSSGLATIDVVTVRSRGPVTERGSTGRTKHHFVKKLPGCKCCWPPLGENALYRTKEWKVTLKFHVVLVPASSRRWRASTEWQDRAMNIAWQRSTDLSAREQATRQHESLHVLDITSAAQSAKSILEQTEQCYYGTKPECEGDRQRAWDAFEAIVDRAAKESQRTRG